MWGDTIRSDAIIKIFEGERWVKNIAGLELNGFCGHNPLNCYPQFTIQVFKNDNAVHLSDSQV